MKLIEIKFILCNILILISYSSHVFPIQNMQSKRDWSKITLRIGQTESFLNRLILPLKLKHLKEIRNFNIFFQERFRSFRMNTHLNLIA